MISTGLMEGTATSTLVTAPLMRPQLSLSARNSGSETPRAVWFAFKSSGEIRKVSDEAAAELARAGVAAETATRMPSADAAFRISDWREAKTLDTIMCHYLMLRPAPYLVQPRFCPRQLICPPLMNRVVSDGSNECNIRVIIAGQTGAQTRRVVEWRLQSPTKVPIYQYFPVRFW